MNYTVKRGDDFSFEIAYYEEDDVTPIDVSGWTFFFTVKLAFDTDDTDALALIAVNTGSMTIDEDVNGSGTDNRVSFVVPRATILLMTVASHILDWQALNESDVLQSHGAGSFITEDKVGRRAV